jgi:hypothetical protein
MPQFAVGVNYQVDMRLPSTASKAKWTPTHVMHQAACIVVALGAGRRANLVLEGASRAVRAGVRAVGQLYLKAADGALLARLLPSLVLKVTFTAVGAARRTDARLVLSKAALHTQCIIARGGLEVPRSTLHAHTVGNGRMLRHLEPASHAVLDGRADAIVMGTGRARLPSAAEVTRLVHLANAVVVCPRRLDLPLVGLALSVVEANPRGELAPLMSQAIIRTFTIVMRTGRLRLPFRAYNHIRRCLANGGADGVSLTGTV